MDKQNKEVNCCPVFDPARWNEKMYTWDNKMFIRGTMPQVLHFPLPGMIRRIMKKLWKQATEAGAEPGPDDFLMLTYDLSPWKCEFYMSVTQLCTGS